MPTKKRRRSDSLPVRTGGKRGLNRYFLSGKKRHQEKILKDMLERGLQSDERNLTVNERRMLRYFRKRPWRAAEFILNIELEVFQKFILFMMFKKCFLLMVLSRGGSKTFLFAVYASVKGILYPECKIGMMSASFRQAKNIFSNMIRWYRSAPLFRACFEKKPVIQQDICTCLMKNGTIIEALPLGDGSKIRGQRYYDLLMDEYAQIPLDILDVVILGMGATTQDPIRNAKLYRLIKRYKIEGKPYDHLLKSISVNRAIGGSTAFYQFNHLWETMIKYYKIIKARNKKDEYWKYGIIKIPYTFLPEGFLDSSFIRMAQNKMSSIEFDMEYRCRFPADTEGFFNAAIVARAYSDFRNRHMFDDEEYDVFKQSGPKAKGEKGKEYVLAIDPARTSDDCSFEIIEKNFKPRMHLLVSVDYIRNKKFRDAADKIWDILRRFNVTDIYMDLRGGGKAIQDSLNDPVLIKALTDIDGRPRDLIWDSSDPFSYFDGEGMEKGDASKLISPKPGRHILKMINFAPKWLSEANHSLLNGLETHKLIFPRKLEQEDLRGISSAEAKKLEKIEQEVVRLQSQLQNIIMTKTPKGIPHWDTPNPNQKKDLYSALLIGYYELSLKEMGRHKDIEPEDDIPMGGFAGELDIDKMIGYDMKKIPAGIGAAISKRNERDSERIFDYFSVSNDDDVSSGFFDLFGEDV